MDNLKEHASKIIILGVVLVIAILFFAFDAQQYLSLEYIQSSRANLEQYYQENQFTMIAVYFLVYVLVTACSLPGAAIMTLAGGAVFGLALGTLIISFASSIGATLAMLLARLLLRDYVQNKFGDYIQRINEGIEKEGAYYLFTMRLVPAIPFFVINLVMGLTPIKALTFYWVSQAGMFIGTIVFVNAGVQLSKITSVGDILTIELWISFILLGITPIALKKGVAYLNQKRAS